MRSRRKKTITFVLGGARSGKNQYAQALASGVEKVTYIATARPRDPEMRRKIARHRRQRPPQWKTAEASRNLGSVIQKEGAKAKVLIIDCLTTYLANVANTRTGGPNRLPAVFQEVCEAVCTSRASVIAISNEVGSGVVPGYRSGRIYRDWLGQLNQQMAALADRVVLMVAGLPLTVKDYALSYGFLPVEDVVDCLKRKPRMLHVILTGRDAKPEIIEVADLVTEMREIKHPFQQGISAQKGIEF